MTKKEKARLRELIELGEETCTDAVAHVGLANYADREHEAMARVSNFFDTLRAFHNEADK